MISTAIHRLQSPVALAWRRRWRSGLPARTVTAMPAGAALLLAFAAASRPAAGAWLVGVGAAGLLAYWLGAAWPTPAISALATAPAVATVLLLLFSPLRIALVVTECALLLGYLVLLDRWEAPGGQWQRRLVGLAPATGAATVLIIGGFGVAGLAVTASMPIAVAGMLTALGAAALTIGSGRFR